MWGFPEAVGKRAQEGSSEAAGGYSEGGRCGRFAEDRRSEGGEKATESRSGDLGSPPPCHVARRAGVSWWSRRRRQQLVEGEIEGTEVDRLNVAQGLCQAVALADAHDLEPGELGGHHRGGGPEGLLAVPAGECGASESDELQAIPHAIV